MANGVMVSTDAGTLTIEGASAGNEADSLTMADNSSIFSTSGAITLRANSMTLDNVSTGGNVLLDSDAAAGVISTQVAGNSRQDHGQQPDDPAGQHERCNRCDQRNQPERGWRQHGNGDGR